LKRRTVERAHYQVRFFGGMEVLSDVGNRWHDWVYLPARKIVNMIGASGPMDTIK